MQNTLIEQAIIQARGRLRVDREAGVIHGVKILGKTSRNGNLYTDQALDDAAGLYEGVEVYDGHHTRKYSDHVGNITEPYREGDAIFGSLKLRPKHALFEAVLEDAEHNPSNLALSHEVLDGNYEATLIEKGRRIDRIFKVDAVAIVKQGGTNQSLVEEQTVSTKEVKTLADLREAYPALLDELTKSLSEGLQAEQKDAEKLARVITERDELAKERDELKGKLDLIEEAQAKAQLQSEILDEAKGMGLEPTDISEDLMEEFLGGMKRETVTSFLKRIKPSEKKAKPESTSGTAPTADDSDKPFYLRGKQ